MRGEFIIAIHALIYLKHKQETVTSDELAQNICSPPPRIRKVMAALKKANLVTTIPGARGGYYLSKDPREITLNQCLDALEDKVVSINWLSGDKDQACLISSGMSSLITDLQGELNKLCYDYLKDKNIEELEQLLFTNK